MRTAAVFALLLAVALTACRNPDVRPDPIVEPSDTTAVDEPLLDPEIIDPMDPSVRQTRGELEARRTILQDPAVTEAQVTMAQDTVLVTAVLTEAGVGDAELKAEQFVTAAYRHVERPGVSATEAPLGRSQYAYRVTLRDEQGNDVLHGFKAPRETSLRTRTDGP